MYVDLPILPYVSRVRYATAISGHAQYEYMSTLWISVLISQIYKIKDNEHDFDHQFKIDFLHRRSMPIAYILALVR